MNDKFESKFYPPEVGQDVLRTGQIISIDEMPFEMVERVVKALTIIEYSFDTPEEEISKFNYDLGTYIDQQMIVFSTPVLTNAGRFDDRPLSACVVPPVDLQGDFSKVKEIVDHYHQDGMGTGFDLSELSDPIETLKYLNQVAIQGSESGKEQRPVGNMATLHISHPKILDFINVKIGADGRSENWKFNLSVNVSNDFMNAVLNNLNYSLQDGKVVNAYELFKKMAEASHLCGDPGIVFLDRMNLHNPTPFTGNYVSTAPCAEVGLAPGESCQFGYINLGKFIKYDQNHKPYIDFKLLGNVSGTLLRGLDNALEISIKNYATSQSKEIMSMKRKVGVGICGYADLLIKLGIPYNSDKAREILLDLVNFINISTKRESVKLAKQRGAAPAVNTVGSKFISGNGYLTERYGNLNTQHVHSEEWNILNMEVYGTGMIRNVTTIALPPTGRSGLVVGASTGVEPLFKLADRYGVNSNIMESLENNDLNNIEIVQQIQQNGKAADILELPQNLRNIFITATEISPNDHLLTIAEVQKAVDESISKTVNLPEESTIEDVMKIQLMAYELGLKGISIFRNNSRFYQPKEL